MLTIMRREGEEVVIGSPAKPLGIVRIVSVKGEKVRLAFDFSTEIPVNRREVAERIRLEGSTRAHGGGLNEPPPPQAA